ncbi:MAG: hypothetical protein IJ274_12950, partial [Lachnospiraceae bacterium]|nr:hypothetical protein [Lachnospiraceae bacterium]
MKKFLSVLLSVIMMFGAFDITFAAEADNEMSINEFLLETGMTQEEIDRIDPDFREYIVENLKENAGSQELEFVETETVSAIEPRVNQVLSGIEFTVSSWKSGSTIYIYPTYEFTTAKRPRGQDSFSFQLGDAMNPHTYGGKIWYKMDADDEWESTSSDTMTANTQTMNGAEFSGTQLGTPDFNIYIKGCAYAHANVGTGS